MHLRLLITTALLCNVLTAENPPPIQVQIPNISLILNNTNDVRASHSSESNQIAHAHATNPYSLLSDASTATKEFTTDALTWMRTNKLKTAAYAAVTSYSYVWYRLISLNYTLSQSNRWSKWQEVLTLEELLKKPQEEIATDLLTAIQRTYTSEEHMDSIITPLIAFVQDVDAETEQLKQLIKLHTWIDRLYIGFLFPKQASLVAGAQESINRLSYLKNVLLTWVSNHKVAQLSTGNAFAA